MTAYRAGPRFPPDELAALLGRHPPTTEQTAVVSAAPDAPLLVVAGAGSGKTETMAARVAWLVANGHARPEQVLGLTFTRKAAAELGHRVRALLGRLRRELGGQEEAGEPTIATYHGYAARILAEHGLRGGYEPAARLLTEAARWQVADAVVRTYDGDMSGVTFAPATVTDAVLALAGELAEHLRDPDEVARWTGRFHATLADLPGRPYAAVKTVRERQQMRLRLLPLVREYARRKREAEAVDFGDQLACAARVARDHPAVGEAERERFRVVLLDEYQDTSHAQVVLLRSLFGGGHPVTAVGDPCQSIYGWRGASTGTLDRFPELFGDLAGQPARVRQLTTSWRNRAEILAVANRLAGPLRAAGARVATLTAAPGARPARAVPVRCTLRETYLEEADWLADQVAGAWRGEHPGAPASSPAGAGSGPGGSPAGAGSGPGGSPAGAGSPPTSAVLVRRRDQIPPVAAALRARGLPVEVVGLGGLLDTPEVRDVVCTLRVLADPADGPALVRLLTGARWRIGPRDLVALHRRARELSGGAEDQGTLAEALDDPGEPARYSPAGYERLRGYGRELAALRRRLDQPLPDLVADVERTTGLEVEVAVAARAAGGDAGLARGHLDALGEVAARFQAEAPAATLAAFLAYLAAAEDEERGLTPGEVEVVEGAVQILTAHAAKGLEWDVVAVAGLTAQVWPPPPKSSDHYLQGVGVLPFPLRGDAGGLPALDLTGVTDQAGAEATRKEFEARWREHDEREERRLAYVAVTRARRLLLASGCWWGEGVKRPRGPSAFLQEIHDTCAAGAGTVDGWAPAPPDGAENPTAALTARAEWPADPLGDRRPALSEAADLVRAAPRAATPAPVQPAQPALAGLAGDDEERWAEQVTLLLAERERRAARAAAVEVPLPAQLSVSQLVALRRDPAGLARSLRRPMPARPDRYARRGSAFHAWLEQRYAGLGVTSQLFDVDEVPGAADPDPAPDDALPELQRAFLASEWAEKVPVAVEVPFATTLAGVTVRGRIDAVFRSPDGGYEVIDWKTGRRPAGAAAEAAAVQLAAYRVAWAALAGVPVADVRAGFHYVAEGVTVRPSDLAGADRLAALLSSPPRADR